MPGQANNFYIFPAVGLAIYATRAKRVSDEMFIEAASAVADQVPEDMLKQGLLYPLRQSWRPFQRMHLGRLLLTRAG